ncbi:MAG: SDR family NAD(P)-dependent oxidoreductase [Polyangiaceae bacterium]
MSVISCEPPLALLVHPRELTGETMKLEDLKIIVTGAAQGMGRHFSLRLAEAGAQVAAGDVNEDGLKSLAEEGSGKTGKVHVRKLNVADEADVAGFVNWTRRDGWIERRHQQRRHSSRWFAREEGSRDWCREDPDPRAVGCGHRRQPHWRNVRGS